MDTSELILYYLPELQEQQQAMEAVLGDLSINGRRLSESDLSLSIGYLVGIPGCEMVNAGSDYKKPDKSFAVLHNLSDGRISEFLAAVRQRDDLRVDLKAVVTEHNMKWNCIDLIEELKREHEVMQAFMSARNALNAARQWQQLINEQNLHVQYGVLLEELNSVVDSASTVIKRGERGIEMELGDLIACRQSLAQILQRLAVHQAEVEGLEEDI